MKKFLAIGLAALLAIGATIVPDEFDKLFLRCNGTTTSFVDSSTANPKTITANGNATQIPVLEAGKPQAMFFNGTTDYVDIANSAGFAFGDGAFEIEFSFMTNIAATAQTLIDNRTATADTDAWLVNIINSSGNKLCFTTATTARITGSTTLAINTKYRCKIVGNGGANGARTVTMYLAVGEGDYAQEGSTYTADYNFAKETLRIGSVKATAGTYYNGWLKNLTLKKAGTTVLDMRGNTPATSPLGPAIYSDEDAYNSITIPNHEDFRTGTGDFTYEGFFLENSYQGADASQMFGFGVPVTNGIAVANYGQIIIYLNSATYFKTSHLPPANKWYHLAIVRSGNNLYCYVDGIQRGSTFDVTGRSITDTTTQFFLGGYLSVDGRKWSGSIREFRFSNVARYTSNFTPSQTGFTVDANTKLYIKGNEDNGSGQSVVPAMTANNAPTPFVASASTEFDGSYPAWKAFDGTTAGYWSTTTAGKIPCWLKIDLGNAKVLNGYSIYMDAGTYAPETWKFQGSNNDSDWTDLDSQASLTFGAGETKQFNFTNSTAYRYYRIAVTANRGANYTYINELKVFNSIVDSETTPKQIIMNGNTVIKYTEDYRSCIFKDETGKFPYPVGSAKVDFMAIGSGAGYFDGTGDYLTTPNSADFDFGTDNLTLEMYIREAVPNARATSLLSKYTAETGWDLYKNGSVYMNFYDGGVTSIGQQTFVAPSIPLANTWWHLALCRVNTTTFRWFFNGTQLGADVSVSAARTFNGPNTLIGIGAEGDGTNPHLGLLDNIRISKGVARYTATFNPPEDYEEESTGTHRMFMVF